MRFHGRGEIVPQGFDLIGRTRDARMAGQADHDVDVDLGVDHRADGAAVARVHGAFVEGPLEPEGGLALEAIEVARRVAQEAPRDGLLGQSAYGVVLHPLVQPDSVVGDGGRRKQGKEKRKNPGGVHRANWLWPPAGVKAQLDASRCGP